jgi:hypothetical protein
MTDPTERAAYEIALRAARHDQARANATIDFLLEKLGLADPTSSQIILPGESQGDEQTLLNVGPIQVADSEFYGLSQTKAAAVFLERAGRSRPQRTEAIIEALRKGGIRFDGKDPAGTFYAILARTPTFHRVGRSTWGLSAWYPNVVRKAKGTTPLAASDESDTSQGPDMEEPPTNTE